VLALFGPRWWSGGGARSLRGPSCTRLPGQRKSRHPWVAAECMPSARSAQEQRLAPKFLLTCLSAVLAESCTFPLDTLKTRLQLAQASQQRSASATVTLAHIIRTEGLSSLYAGLSPALARHIPYSGTRILAYEALRGRLGAEGLGSLLALGAASGALGQIVAVPADVVKVRMQADGALVRQGCSPRYRGLSHALSTIVQAEGVPGLWRGTLPAVQRAALVNLGELATYDAAKRWAAQQPLFGEGTAANVFASLASGLAATAASCPADVLKSRLMNQKPGDGVRYSGMLDCARRSVAAEGWGVLYRGFWPTWARLGPWQLTFWMSYETLRKHSGLGGF